MSGRLFRCAQCHGEFETGWSEEEAKAEALALFAITDATPADALAEVCDDCFQKMTAAYPPEQYMRDLSTEAAGDLHGVLDESLMAMVRGSEQFGPVYSLRKELGVGDDLFASIFAEACREVFKAHMLEELDRVVPQ